MRVLLIVAAAVALLFVAGWLTFNTGDGDASLNVETDRIRQDTQELIEGGQRTMQDVDDKVDIQVRD